MSDGDRYYLVSRRALADGERDHSARDRGGARRDALSPDRRVENRNGGHRQSRVPRPRSRRFAWPRICLLESGTGPLNDKQQELVVTARDETERLRAMVDELLDLVRIEADAGALRRVKIDPTQVASTAPRKHTARSQTRSTFRS